jgi:hypothetical protein
MKRSDKEEFILTGRTVLTIYIVMFALAITVLLMHKSFGN